MRKIYKIINITLISVLLGMFIWVDAGYALRPPLLFNIKNRAEDKIECAVVLLVTRIAGKWHFLITERAQGLLEAGLWVLPGGKKDQPDPTLRQTALREFREEMGSPLPAASIVMALGYIDTLDEIYRIHPFLAVIDEPINLNPNRVEVSDEAWIPIDQMSAEKIVIQRGSEEIVLELGKANQIIIARSAIIVQAIVSTRRTRDNL